MPRVIAPILHLSGDRAEVLLNALEDAYEALATAQQALKACAGNQRNFYVEPGRWEQYCDQHTLCLQHLQAVQASLLEEYKAIEAQQ